VQWCAPNTTPHHATLTHCTALNRIMPLRIAPQCSAPHTTATTHTTQGNATYASHPTMSRNSTFSLFLSKGDSYCGCATAMGCDVTCYRTLGYRGPTKTRGLSLTSALRNSNHHHMFAKSISCPNKTFGCELVSTPPPRTNKKLHKPDSPRSVFYLRIPKRKH